MLQQLDQHVENRVVEFKKPAPVMAKQKILSEETYIEEMAKIIQRDFFPDLEKLRAQNDYLDAMDRRDFAQMQAIRAKYSGNKPINSSYSMTPTTFETPSSSVENTPRVPESASVASNTPNTSRSSKKSDDSSLSYKHSLDSFLNAYTSEDNHSFQEIIRAADEKIRQKFAVLYNEEQLSAAKLAHALTLPSIAEQFNQAPAMQKLETWTYTNKNSIMYVPDGVDLTAKERVEAANNKHSVIQHNATRLNTNPFEVTKSRLTDETRTQVSSCSDNIGLDGKTAADRNTPQIRGFNLVKTPSPRPGEAFSPLMTWGEIEGTPFRLDGATPIRANAGPAFKITENSRRENIAIALAEKVAEKMRVQKQRALDTAKRNINSPLIRSNMDRLASMSPAARRLATTKLGLRSPSLTPTPYMSHKKPACKKLSDDDKANKTGSSKTTSSPMIAKSLTPRDNNSSKTLTLTDNLLKIPTKKRRPNAADFF